MASGTSMFAIHAGRGVLPNKCTRKTLSYVFSIGNSDTPSNTLHTCYQNVFYSKTSILRPPQERGKNVTLYNPTFGKQHWKISRHELIYLHFCSHAHASTWHHHNTAEWPYQSKLSDFHFPVSTQCTLRSSCGRLWTSSCMCSRLSGKRLTLMRIDSFTEDEHLRKLYTIFISSTIRALVNRCGLVRLISTTHLWCSEEREKTQ